MEPTWRAVASKLAGDVSVGAIDSTKERALAARFGVRAFPSLYLLRDGAAYAYGNRPRTEAELVAFAQGGWLDADPLPSHRAPNSGVGRALGSIAAAPGGLAATYRRLHHGRGWPALAVVGDTLLLFGGLVEAAHADATLDDVWSLNLKKLDAWACLRPSDVGEGASGDDGEWGTDSDDDRAASE